MAARRRPGDFVAVPLPSGGFGYARVLDKLFAFYDVRSDGVIAVADLEAAPILFIVGVHISALTQWRVIGHRTLEPPLKEDIKFFRRDILTGDYLIYVSKAQPKNAYAEYK